MPPPRCPSATARIPGSWKLCPAPSQPAPLRVAQPIRPAQLPAHPQEAGGRRKWPSHPKGPEPPRRSLERSHGLWPACVPVSVSVSLCVRVPKCRRQPVYVGPVLAWQTLVQGDFPWGPGGLQGGREPWGAAEHRAAGLPGATATGVGRAWGSVDADCFVLSVWVPGLRSSVQLDGRLRA